eukprot:5785496-Pleurochrysis_carterae.AAC.3
MDASERFGALYRWDFRETATAGHMQAWRKGCSTWICALSQVLCLIQVVASVVIMILLEDRLHDYVYELFTVRFSLGHCIRFSNDRENIYRFPPYSSRCSVACTSFWSQSGAVLLCGFAAIVGFLGVCFKNRALLLFFYINQLYASPFASPRARSALL